MSAVDGTQPGDRPRASSDFSALEMRVTVHDDAPDECTFAPRDATGLDLMSQWITATVDSLVPLEEMR